MAAATTKRKPPLPVQVAAKPVTTVKPALTIPGDRALELQTVPDQLPALADTPGGHGGGPTAPTTAAVSKYGTSSIDHDPDAQTREWVLDHYGPQWASFVDDPGDIGNVVRRAVRDARPGGAGEWSMNQLANTIAATPAYMNLSQNQRNFDYKQKYEPGQAIQDFKNFRAKLADKASRYGTPISPGDLDSIATDALRNGWDGDENRINSMLLSHMDASKGLGTGSLAGIASGIRRTMKSFMLPISEATIADWTQRRASGELDPAVLDDMIRAQAKARFPHMADLIDRGGTPDDYYQPYKQTLARELELNPETIDMTDPKYSSIIDGGATGKPMSLTEAARFARMQPEWKSTDRANAQGASFTKSLLESFGKLAV